MNVVETLQENLSSLEAQLQELDEKLKNERPALVGQVSQLKRAIAALTKQPNTGPRKPMSPEAKERIRAGLEKARAAKLAAQAVGTAQPSASVAPVAGKKVDTAKSTPRVS